MEMVAEFKRIGNWKDDERTQKKVEKLIIGLNRFFDQIAGNMLNALLVNNKYDVQGEVLKLLDLTWFTSAIGSSKARDFSMWLSELLAHMAHNWLLAMFRVRAGTSSTSTAGEQGPTLRVSTVAPSTVITDLRKRKLGGVNDVSMAGKRKLGHSSSPSSSAGENTKQATGEMLVIDEDADEYFEKEPEMEGTPVLCCSDDEDE